MQFIKKFLLGNHDSENNTHPRSYIAVDLNELDEIVSNNNLPVLNRSMLFYITSNNISEETIQIQIETIVELWNFFIKYFLKPGLLRVFQPRSRDVLSEKCGEVWVFISKKLIYHMIFFLTKKS